MYTVAIIEDDEISYTAVATKVSKYVGVTLNENIQVIRDTPNPDLNESATHFKEYVDLLNKYPSDIYVVDWELKFGNGKLSSPKEIFTLLAKEMFVFTDKYWLFYSKDKGSEGLDFVGQYLPSNCYTFKGKGLITGDLPDSGTYYLENILHDAIDYLDKKRIPEELKGLTCESDSIRLDIPKGNCYDIEQYHEFYESIYTKETRKTSWPQPCRPLFCREKIICLAYNYKTGILLVLDNETNRLRLYLINADSMAHTKRLLNHAEVSGFIYNPIFFDTNIHLLQEFKEFVQHKTQILQQVYHKRSIYEEAIEILKQLQILKDHGLIK